MLSVLWSSGRAFHQQWRAHARLPHASGCQNARLAFGKSKDCPGSGLLFCLCSLHLRSDVSRCGVGYIRNRWIPCAVTTQARTEDRECWRSARRMAVMTGLGFMRVRPSASAPDGMIASSAQLSVPCVRQFAICTGQRLVSQLIKSSPCSVITPMPSLRNGFVLLSCAKATSEAHSDLIAADTAVTVFYCTALLAMVRRFCSDQQYISSTKL